MDVELRRDVEARKSKIIQALIDWGKQNLRSFPWREERTPYKVLIAEIILRRTTAKAACKVYENFLNRYPDINTLSQADVKELEKLLSAVGYHKRRASILKEIARFIVSEYNGVIPDRKDKLVRIPQVGQYIAGAILSLGYGIPSSMVDSNVKRIITRVFSKKLPEKKKDQALYEIADALVPNDGHELFNLALLDLGASVCRYNKPVCDKCPLRDVCDTAAEYMATVPDGSGR